MKRRDEPGTYFRCACLSSRRCSNSSTLISSSWNSLRSSQPKKGERSVATGRAVGVIDNSAEEVAAWLFDYCSNERTRISKEEGNPARIELKVQEQERRVNEIKVATIKKMPFPLQDR